MRNQTLLIALLIMMPALAWGASDDEDRGAHNAQTLEQHVDSIAGPPLEQAAIAGLAVGVAQEGRVLLLDAYGFADLEDKTPLESDALFPVASVTKTLTSIAILQLVEDGLIALDDDITQYLDFDTGEHTVTIRQLLNHTSGIKDYTESDIPEQMRKNGYSPRALMRLLQDKQFDFAPGEAMDYSNSGYYLLAMIIERVSRLPYDEFLREHILTPASMESTANCYSEDLLPGTVQGYSADRDGRLHPASLGDFRMATGAGSVCSTAEDLLTMQIALHDRRTLLSRDSYSSITGRGNLEGGRETNYGFGIEVQEYKGNRVFSHNGIIDGYLSDTRYFPEQRLSIVVLVNTLGPVKPAGIANEIADYFISEQDRTQALDVPLAGMLGKYEGVVMGSTIVMEVVEQEGRLAILGRGQTTPLEYRGDGVWRAEDGYTYAFLDGRMQVNGPKLSILFSKMDGAR